MTNMEKLQEFLKENDLELQINVNVEHANEEVAKSVLLISNWLWVKFMPVVHVIDKPKEYLPDDWKK